MPPLAPAAALGDHGGMIRPAVLLAPPLLLLAACDRVGSGTAAPVASAEPAAAADAQGVVVIAAVEDVEPGGEPVDVALQTEDQWNTQNAAYRARVPADAARVALRFEGVRPGRYVAIAVQPNTPELRRRDEEAVDAAIPTVPRLPSLRADSPGGRGVSNSDARRTPDFGGSVFEVKPDGATVPLTLQRH